MPAQRKTVQPGTGSLAIRSPAMRTLSTLVISSAVIAALMTGASMAMRPAPSGDGQGAAKLVQVTAANPAARTWSEPPERALPAAAIAAAPVDAISERPVEAMRAEEPRREAVKPAARERPRRAVARSEAPRPSEAARPRRRVAQATLRPRAAPPRAESVAATVAPSRPVDPISDFLRGVGLLDDGHG